jgi:hypothetical protein
MEGLTVGRMVHYVAYGTPGGEYEAGAHRAAIVAELHPEMGNKDGSDYYVTLMVINPTGIHFHTALYNAAGCIPGTWHWIEKA